MHAKTMQTASPIDGFVMGVTRGKDTTDTGDFSLYRHPIGDLAMQGV